MTHTPRSEVTFGSDILNFREHYAQRAWCNIPASYRRCLPLPLSHALGPGPLQGRRWMNVHECDLCTYSGRVFAI